MNPGRERNQTTCSGSFEVGSTNQDRVRKGLGSSGERKRDLFNRYGSRLFISIEFNGESVLRHDGCQIQCTLRCEFGAESDRGAFEVQITAHYVAVPILRSL